MTQIDWSLSNTLIIMNIISSYKNAKLYTGLSAYY